IGRSLAEASSVKAQGVNAISRGGSCGYAEKGVPRSAWSARSATGPQLLRRTLFKRSLGPAGWNHRATSYGKERIWRRTARPKRRHFSRQAPRRRPFVQFAQAQPEGKLVMAIVTTSDGTDLFYKDWGPKDAPPVMFHHGWPLSSDDWDSQMLFFLSHGYRVIAHDRRGHGRSNQTDTGNETDTYAADVAALVKALDLQDVVHIGHSTGGGEVARYAARAERGRVAKAVLI